ncbi:MAG TPA: hypothetical protein VL977_08240 [Solirubrobacteraceae bacterium]|nr:hypothetical protein [Solirubrobacteraceae bacterium]
MRLSRHGRRRAAHDGAARARRFSYANVASTIALVIAVGGGTAWAAHHLHYIITKTNQIKPSVLSTLHGANGSPGANGATGATGSTGSTGSTGAQGPSASSWDVTVDAGQTSATTGTIPVELTCVQEAGEADAFLYTTETSGIAFPHEHGGSFFSEQTENASSSSPESGSVSQENGGYPTSGTSDIGGDAGGNAAIGHTLLTYYSGLIGFGALPVTTETISWALTTGTGTGSSGTCNVDAQITPNG